MTSRLVGSKTSADNKHLDAVHGVRVLSAAWILLGHTYASDPGTYDRPYHLFDKLSDPFFNLMVQSVFGVDSFIALTGILLYKTLKTERTRYQVSGQLFTWRNKWIHFDNKQDNP